MKQSMLFGVAVLLVAVSSLSATPLPVSVLGTDKTVEIADHSLAVLTGGGFLGQLDGIDTYFWCSDWENSVGVPDSYQADVVALGNWTDGKNSQVQKGTNTNWSLNLPDLTPLQRYQVAAYLLSQMQTYQNLSQQNGAVLTADQNLQESIWKVLNLGAPSASSPTPSDTTVLDAAINYVIAHPTYGYGSWAVVSGVSNNGALSDTRKQTFLVPIEFTSVPEPGTYALIGLGLTALALVHKKRA